jgi:predicted metal-binding membrane protein
MMAAMMLPSAIPMVALYHRVNGVMAGHPHRRMSPTAVFVTPYVLVWLLSGLPVYVASALVSVSVAAGAHDWMVWLEPYAVAAVLAGAGVYQLSAAKRACLRACRTPLDLLARRWRPGLAGAARVGLVHAAYCLGCCWALMVVLVAAGAMGLTWVVLIAGLVLAEKLLRPGERVARLAGVVLIGLGLAVALRPGAAAVLAG